MQRSKKIASVLLSVTMLSGACAVAGSTTAHASGTGAGLAEWALNAYYSGWSYVYGGATPGTVDCSVLFIPIAEATQEAEIHSCMHQAQVDMSATVFHEYTDSVFIWMVMSVYISATVWQLTQETMTKMYAMTP